VWGVCMPVLLQKIGCAPAHPKDVYIN